MPQLRFGILGLSPGNGHPYSWSAIFNGYDAKAMATCPFPTIPAYLAQRRFPEDAIAGATVTHVWTQDRAISEHIAAAALIPSVVNDPRELLGVVDAVLLARDDAKSHLALAAPFLEAGIPVYIDKPLALARTDAEAMYRCQHRPGLLFTCSALAYAREFQLSPHERAALGPLRYVDAVTAKDWDRYAMHVLEPLIALLDAEGPVVRTQPTGARARGLDLTWASGVEGRVTALGTAAGPIAIRLYGETAAREMVFADSFSAFRAALVHFTDIVSGRQPPQDPGPVLNLVGLIEAGRIAS